MALDRQRILTELGSVMNQLQSADCGCMGKLFSNSSGQEGAPTPQPSGRFGGFGGCKGGCCHGHRGCNFGFGLGTPGTGDPSSGPCMGKCNPRKIYADTYNYLNQNLMQPTVKEVYNDLKSITPENTVMNNASKAGKMGMSPQGGHSVQGGNLMQGENLMQGGNPMQGENPMHGGNPMHGRSFMQGGNPMGAENAMHGGYGMQGGNVKQDAYYMQGGGNQIGNNMQGNPLQGGTYMQENGYHPQNQMQGMGYQMQAPMQDNMGMPQNQMDNQNVGQNMFGSMGPQIVNMMSSSAKGKPTNSPQGSQMPGSMLIDAPQSPHGKVGVTPLTASGGINQAQYNANSGNLNGSNEQMYSIPTTQYVTDPNTATGFNPNIQNYNAINTVQQNQPNPNALKTGNSNLNAQQLGSPNQNYGHHNQGIKKFNEMFPGVMQGMGGDLGFDPMAIAIQMNPENHRKAAMDTMQKMMSGNKLGRALDTTSTMKTALGGANTVVSNMSQENVAPSNQLNIPPSNQLIYNGQLGSATTPVTQVPQQQVYEANKVIQQPGYNDLTVLPAMNQGLSAQNMQPQQPLHQYQQQVIDPNTGAPMAQAVTPVSQGATENVNVEKQQQQPQDNTAPSTPDMNGLMIQDPIFPVDTSRYQVSPSLRRTKYYQYNTLGQPVEVLPAKLYHSLPETSLPQTLSPQPGTGKLRNDIGKFDVKSTVSKTALMSNRPVGKTPSRSQLQNIYNQYKGSHSHTQQNIRNPAQSETYSEGKIGIQRENVNPPRQIPVEKLGGDTVLNNQLILNQTAVKEQPMQQTGDMHVNKPCGDNIDTKDPPKMQGNCRNGLQDMVYTSYPSTAAWSFHGDDFRPSSFATARRFRNRN